MTKPGSNPNADAPVACCVNENGVENGYALLHPV